MAEVVSHLSNHLTPEQQERLEEPVSLGELSSTIWDLSTDKTAGTDGLPMEFYHHLWHVLGEDYLEVLRELATSPRFPDSMRRGVVNLMHKKGNREDLSN